MKAGALLMLQLLKIAGIGSYGPPPDCRPTVTTASGSRAPKKCCSGELIFSDDFNNFDLHTWEHEITLAGGGNWEFEMYVNNRTTSFTKDGKLFIKPTLTSDQYGENFLYYGTISLNGANPADQCTNPTFWGCERTGTPTHILNPIKSARIRSANSFSFKYGRLEVRAKMPAGDWLWPAIWLIPRYNQYGIWPASGEIDLVEMRGNRNLRQNGVNIGTELITSSLHFGPYEPLDGYYYSFFEKRSPLGQGYNKNFHRYQLEWTPAYIKFSIDDQEIGKITPTSGGFWDLGKFSQIGSIVNPWRSGNKMAPFDKEFYIIFNVAVGGVNGYFPDNVENPGGKPWKTTSSRAATDFWEGRNQWLPTWKLGNSEETASLQVDYVKVWAL